MAVYEEVYNGNDIGKLSEEGGSWEEDKGNFRVYGTVP